MKKIFEAPEITKLSLVTENVTLDLGDYLNVGEGSSNYDLELD